MKTSEQITYTVLAERDKQLAERKKRNRAALKFVPVGAAAAIAVTAGVLIAGNIGKDIETSASVTTEPKAYIIPYIAVEETMPETTKPSVVNETQNAIDRTVVPEVIPTTGEYGEETTMHAVAPSPAPDGARPETAGGAGTEATFADTAVMTTAVSGGNMPMTTRADEMPYETTRPPEKENGACLPAPSWEERSLPQRFNSFNLGREELDDYVYQGTDIAPEKVGEKYMDVTAKGFDFYNDDKEYEITAHLYRIKGISEKAAVALKFDDDDKYYIYKHYFGYAPGTLGQLIDDLGLMDNVSFGNIFISWKYSDEGRTEYDPIPMDSKKTKLLKDLLAEFRGSKCEIKDDFRGSSSFTVTTYVADIGVNNRSLSFFDSGYMMTNIMEYGLYVYIGEDRVAELKEALGVNAAPSRFVPNTDPVLPYVAETTQPAHPPVWNGTGDPVNPVVSEAVLPEGVAVMTTSSGVMPVVIYTSEE